MKSKVERCLHPILIVLMDILRPNLTPRTARRLHVIHPSSLLQSDSTNGNSPFDAPGNLHRHKNTLQRSKLNGLGPILSLLPENLMYYIISFIDYFERNPTILLVSHCMTKLLTRPEFLFELKYVHEKCQNEIECNYYPSEK
ncbi:hypothetical protein ACHAWU_001528 [Discostella pseudostelligera]|uniref:F-box domain-containing protein n=1 Tax=Discostella pseudostelligera TaxID=259834 RepID=A0ABD3MLR4_9STRA